MRSALTDKPHFGLKGLVTQTQATRSSAKSIATPRVFTGQNIGS